MYISRLVVYAQPIDKSNRIDLRQEGKSPRFDESSNRKPKRRLFHLESSMGNKDRVSHKNSQGGGHTLERPMCTTYGKQNMGMCLYGSDV